MFKLLPAVWAIFQHFSKVKNCYGLTLMPTAIINSIYLLCSILFEINMLFLVSSHINVEQFFGSYNYKRLHDHQEKLSARQGGFR